AHHVEPRAERDVYASEVAKVASLERLDQKRTQGVTARRISGKPGSGVPSDAHGHDDGEELLARWRGAARGAKYGGVQLPGEADLDLVGGDRREHVEEVLGVEPDAHRGAAELHRNLVEAVAALRRLARDAHGALGERQLHATGALAGGDRDRLERIREGGPRRAHDLVVGLRNDLRVRRKLCVDEL